MGGVLSSPSRRDEIMRASEVIVEGLVEGRVPTESDVVFDDYYDLTGFGPEVFWKAVARLEREGIVWQGPEGHVRVVTINRPHAERALWLRHEVEKGGVHRLAQVRAPVWLDRVEPPPPSLETVPFFKLDLQYHSSLMRLAGLQTGEVGVRDWKRNSHLSQLPSNQR